MYRAFWLAFRMIHRRHDLAGGCSCSSFHGGSQQSFETAGAFGSSSTLRLEMGRVGITIRRDGLPLESTGCSTGGLQKRLVVLSDDGEYYNRFRYLCPRNQGWIRLTLELPNPTLQCFCATGPAGVPSPTVPSLKVEYFGGNESDSCVFIRFSLQGPPSEVESPLEPQSDVL
jgi:hypothetical protein